MAGALGLLPGWVETFFSFRWSLFLRFHSFKPLAHSLYLHSYLHLATAKASGFRPELPCSKSSLISCSLQTEVTKSSLETPTPDTVELNEDYMYFRSCHISVRGTWMCQRTYWFISWYYVLSLLTGQLPMCCRLSAGMRGQMANEKRCIWQGGDGVGTGQAAIRHSGSFFTGHGWCRESWKMSPLPCLPVNVGSSSSLNMHSLMKGGAFQ